jgi:hypothetical protein
MESEKNYSIKELLKNMSFEDRVQLMRQIADEEKTAKALEDEKQRKIQEEEENSIESIPMKLKSLSQEIKELRKDILDIKLSRTSFNCREIFTNRDLNIDLDFDNRSSMSAGNSELGECPFSWWGIFVFFFMAMIIFSIFDGGVKNGRCPMKFHID